MISVNENKLVEIFRIILELDDNQELASVNRLTDENWDSLAHVSIVAAIESEFGLNLEISDMECMTSFSETRLLLEGKGL